MKCTIGMCLVSRTALAGERVSVLAPDGEEISGELTELPFL